ncbi:MAG: NADH-quinone oxidoreductase subunit C, partial [Candidatus Sumerlaeia bacterium]|nr:NADH-quinone oxidoreductase subunit C [Candidatus Sumerlaeia bacterium]
MNFTEIYVFLKDRFADKILAINEANIDPFIVVEPTALVEIMQFLKLSEKTQFDFLSCISGVDYPEEQTIEVVYHLFSYSRGG